MRKVFIYRNIRTGKWSVRDVKSGLVIASLSRLTLANATFKVSEAGRQRVLREKRKNVHAGVLGELIESRPLCPTPVSYNPYKYSTFINKAKGDEPVLSAQFVEFTPEGKVYAQL
jgi:hypothetical protein